MNYFCRTNSPLGELLLVSDGESLTGLYMSGQAEAGRTGACRESLRLFMNTIEQLKEYFAGCRRDFNLPLKMAGTAFQKSVWDELGKIPYGECCSYGEIARRIGKPQAARAVGLANAANPVSIIVPCHRVIGQDGALTGYGGGLARKRFLLALESNETGEPAGGTQRRSCTISQAQLHYCAQLD
jgi:methylated-DNA-[protein]-cysteine S-methyltransferase